MDCFQPSQWSTTAAAQMQVSGRGGHPTVSNKWFPIVDTYKCWVLYEVTYFACNCKVFQIVSLKHCLVLLVCETENMMLVLNLRDIPWYQCIPKYIVHFQILVCEIYRCILQYILYIFKSQFGGYTCSNLSLGEHRESLRAGSEGYRTFKRG